MAKRIGGLITSVSLLMVLAMCLLVCSCKKAPEQAPPQESQAQVPSEPNEKAQFDAIVKELEANAAQAQPAVAEQKPQAPEAPAAEPNKVQPAPADTNTAGLEPIPLVLPKKVFIGTPTDIRVPNLEKPLGKPRPDFLAPAGTKNVAFQKPIASSDEQPIIGEIEMITDGDKEASDGSYVELGPFLQNVTIDLGEKYNIYAIVVWHYHKQAQVYFDVIVQVADDKDFISNVKTLFNNDVDNSAGLGTGTDMHYVETNEGKLIDAKGVQARFVRLYSNGNSSNELNHYIEVEVYGTPVK